MVLILSIKNSLLKYTLKALHYTKQTIFFNKYSQSEKKKPPIHNEHTVRRTGKKKPESFFLFFILRSQIIVLRKLSFQNSF